jgi:hypothetical protein
MTRAADDRSPQPDPVQDDAGDALDEQQPLPGFAVMARFRRAAGSAGEAEVAVREEIAAARGMFENTVVEPQEPDGRWAVDVRFVVVSVDAERAVDGVHSTLTEAGMHPDEVWVAETLP